MPDYSIGRSGKKLRFANDRIKISLYRMKNDKGWLFEEWVNENPICYEQRWTECFFKNKCMKTCAFAELCYNKHLNGINIYRQFIKK